MNKVILFTKHDCTPCKMVKQYFNSNNVEFEELDIYENEDAVKEYEVMSVPTVIYTEEDSDEEIRASGFDMPTLEKIVIALFNTKGGKR